jgi:Rod binding domain-containing protein
MNASLAIGSASAAGSPVVDEARAPAAVRDGSAAVKQAYASAQGFEEMLLQQLSQSMLQSSGLGGEGGTEGEAGSSEEGSSSENGGMLSSLLPQALTEGVMRQGGLGLASQLTGSLDPAASAHGSATDGGVSASSTGGTAPGGGVAAPAQEPGAVGPTGGVSA